MKSKLVTTFKMSALCCATSILFTGCASVDRVNNFHDNLRTEMAESTKPVITKVEEPIKPVPVSTPVVPVLSPAKKEVRFNFIMNNVPVTTVLDALVEGTSYSMVLPQELTGNVTLNLKNVTAFDVLETLRTIYNYEYEVTDKRIVVYPNGLRTKIFHINHLVGARTGSSSLKIDSGSLTDNVGGSGGSSTNTSTNNSGTTTTPTSGNGKTNTETSKITTNFESDFWKELNTVLTTLVGTEKGRLVVVSPQTNTIMIKAMPSELNEAEKYMDKIQVIVDRQVIIEAKIIEVQLNNSMQTGINWAAFKGSKLSAGFGASGSTLATTGDLSLSGNNPVTATPGSNLVTGTLANAAGSMFSLAFQSSNFASVLNFLETQGDLQVLSSPRIATMNNEKALLKVGTDEFFITNVTTTSTSTASGTTNTPSVTTQPFFSGIALDITPEIDENGSVTMHVRPSVSKVSTVTKSINLGSLGSIVLPLASSTISETDSIVKVDNDQIVAIGGLMKQYSQKDKSQVPEVGELPVVGNAFKSTDSNYQKYELVILLKPHVINSRSDWQESLAQVHERLMDFDQPSKNLVIGTGAIENPVASVNVGAKVK